MKKLISALIISASALSAAPAMSNELGSCLIDSLNGKERKWLAKWIFFSMAAHPEIKNYAEVSEKDRLESDKDIGDLVTRLLASDCPAQFKVASESDPMALQRAFELVGQVAMGELMQDPVVTDAIGNYSHFMDPQAIQSALAGGQ